MVDRDVVLAKVATIDRCLSRIVDVRARRAQLLPLDVEDLVLFNLQRAAQTAIDLASHVTTTEAFGLPDSVASTFTLLERNGVIDGDLAGRMRSASRAAGRRSRRRSGARPGAITWRSTAITKTACREGAPTFAPAR